MPGQGAMSVGGTHKLKILRCQNNTAIAKEEWEKMEGDLLDYCIRQCLTGSSKDDYEHHGFFYDKERSAGQILCSTHRSSIWWKEAVRHVTHGRAVAVTCQTERVKFSISAKSRSVTDLTIIRSILAGNLGTLSQYGVVTDCLCRELDLQGDILHITAHIPSDQAKDLREMTVDGQLHWPGGRTRLHFLGRSEEMVKNDSSECQNAEMKEETGDDAPANQNTANKSTIHRAGPPSTPENVLMATRKRRASNGQPVDSAKQIRPGGSRGNTDEASVSADIDFKTEADEILQSLETFEEAVKDTQKTTGTDGSKEIETSAATAAATGRSQTSVPIKEAANGKAALCSKEGRILFRKKARVQAIANANASIPLNSKTTGPQSQGSEAPARSKLPTETASKCGLTKPKTVPGADAGQLTAASATESRKESEMKHQNQLAPSNSTANNATRHGTPQPKSLGTAQTTQRLQQASSSGASSAKENYSFQKKVEEPPKKSQQTSQDEETLRLWARLNELIQLLGRRPLSPQDRSEIESAVPSVRRSILQQHVQDLEQEEARLKLVALPDSLKDSGYRVVFYDDDRNVGLAARTGEERGGFNFVMVFGSPGADVPFLKRQQGQEEVAPSAHINRALMSVLIRIRRKMNFTDQSIDILKESVRKMLNMHCVAHGSKSMDSTGKPIDQGMELQRGRMQLALDRPPDQPSTSRSANAEPIDSTRDSSTGLKLRLKLGTNSRKSAAAAGGGGAANPAVAVPSTSDSAARSESSHSPAKSPPIDAVKFLMQSIDANASPRQQAKAFLNNLVSFGKEINYHSPEQIERWISDLTEGNMSARLFFGHTLQTYLGVKMDIPDFIEEGLQALIEKKRKKRERKKSGPRH